MIQTRPIRFEGVGGKDVEENHRFKKALERVRDCMKDLMMFNLEPSVSVSSNEY